MPLGDILLIDIQLAYSTNLVTVDVWWLCRSSWQGRWSMAKTKVEEPIATDNGSDFDQYSICRFLPIILVYGYDVISSYRCYRSINTRQMLWVSFIHRWVLVVEGHLFNYMPSTTEKVVYKYTGENGKLLINSLCYW